MKSFVFIFLLSVTILSDINALVVNGGIYFLFYGSNLNDYIRTTSNFNFISLKNTKYFNTNKPTAVFFHGWGCNFSQPHNEALTAAFINRGDYNTVIVDWKKYSSIDNYFVVASSINDQAKFISKVIIQMGNAGYNLTSFYFIGHSLGANLVGRVGYQLIKIYNFTPTRITGLDPCGHFFGKFNHWPKHFSLIFPSLNTRNAKFVDLIHADAGGSAISWSAGHLDFWPNYGHNQPGCPKFPYFFNCNPFDPFCIGCSHIQALRYFVESVQSTSRRKFKSRLCNGTNYLNGECYGPAASMGIYADQYASNPGNYFLRTFSHPPYSVSNVF